MIMECGSPAPAFETNPVHKIQNAAPAVDGEVLL
jgi:hypothetical protein